MNQDWLIRILKTSIEDLKPVIDDDASDSAALILLLELLVKSNKSLPMAKILTIPEAWSHRRDFFTKIKKIICLCHAVMEAWDGPAAICGAHDDWAIAGMDRNGLKTSIRYTLTQNI